MSTSSSEALSSLVEAVPSADSAKTTTSRALAGIHNGVSHAGEQLTDTVQALAQKVPLSSRGKGKWQVTKDTAHAARGQATQHLQDGKKTVHDTAHEVTRQAKSLTNQAAAQMPAPVTGRVAQLAVAARQRPVSTAAMVFALFALLLLRRFIHQARG
jgi:ElaB/YqjD/DUF883 family membrane-anchored ribosome-binding protein